MKKIIITGIHGQDGIILSRILLKKKYQVIGLSNKKTNLQKRLKVINIKNKKLKDIKKILNIISPDVIVHFGSTNPSYNKHFKKKDYLTNIKFTKFLIQFIFKKKIKFIYPGSSVIFRQTLKKINENSPVKINNYYAKFRNDTIKYLLKKKKEKKLNSTIVILFNHDSKFRNKRFLLPRLISSIKRNKLKFLKEIYQQNINGDFSHAEDICNAIYLLIKKDLNPDKIILSSGQRTYINNIIDYFMPDFKYKNLKIKLSTSKGLVGNNIKSVKILKWKIKKTLRCSY